MVGCYGDCCASRLEKSGQRALDIFEVARFAPAVGEHWIFEGPRTKTGSHGVTSLLFSGVAAVPVGQNFVARASCSCRRVDFQTLAQL